MAWLLVSSCVDTFAPPEVASAANYLVVDGFLNVAGEASQLQLSRTQNAADPGKPQAELRAQVSVEGDKGSRYSFTETGNGTYQLAPQSVDATQQYRLRIQTANGRTYLSDYVAVKKTPPIDSLTYRIDLDRGGVQIYANTHDPLNQTRFYRWRFEETWEYSALAYSGLEIKNEQIVTRQNDIFLCWATARSSAIGLGTSIKLSEDLLREAPITLVPISSGKLQLTYSVLVRQYALTQEGFQYWTSLAKTTDNTGGLFDPLPSQVTGNIRCTDDAQELVFGFFSATSVQEKRLFVKVNLGRTATCKDIVTLEPEEAIRTSRLLLYWANPEKTRVTTAPPSCADCRLQGGTNVKPDFWQ